MADEKQKRESRSRFNPETGSGEYNYGLIDGVYRLSAGMTRDGEDRCAIDMLSGDQPFLSPDQAIELATDLLRWAQFIRECELARKEMLLNLHDDTCVVWNGGKCNCPVDVFKRQAD